MFCSVKQCAYICALFHTTKHFTMSRTSNLLQKAKLTPEEVSQIAKAAGTLVTKMEQSDTNDDGKYSTTEIAFVEDPDGYKIEFIQMKSATQGLG